MLENSIKCRKGIYIIMQVFIDGLYGSYVLEKSDQKLGFITPHIWSTGSNLILRSNAAN